MDFLLHFLFVSLPKLFFFMMFLYLGASTFGGLLGLNIHHKRLSSAGITPFEREEATRKYEIVKREVLKMAVMTAIFGLLWKAIH